MLTLLEKIEKIQNSCFSLPMGEVFCSFFKHESLKTIVFWNEYVVLWGIHTQVNQFELEKHEKEISPKAISRKIKPIGIFYAKLLLSELLLWCHGKTASRSSDPRSF